MRGFPGNPSFCTRTTVIARKSVILLTSVLAYKLDLTALPTVRITVRFAEFSHVTSRFASTFVR